MTKSKIQKKILIVEDDEPILNALMAKLKKEGLDATLATDALMGIQKLREEGPFACVLVDIRMPKENGFWFLEEKLKDPTFGLIPVIVFTNFSTSDYVKRSLSLGAKGYLVKANHRLQEIVDEVKSCLAGKECTIDS